MRESRGWALGVVVLLALVVSSSALPSKSHLKTSSSSNGSRVDDTLKFIAVVAAHGNTAPSFDYSGNPYPPTNTIHWPFGAGAVTSVGRNSLYRLGKTIRALYNGFIDEVYDKYGFKINSPEVDQATISAQLFAAGLYPPVEYEVWNQNLHWQPLEVQIETGDETQNIATCKRFLEETEKSLASFETKYKSNILDVTTYLSNSTGISISGAPGMASVWEMLLSQKIEGLTLPSWASKVYPSPMKNLSGEYYRDYYAGSDESVRLVIGVLFEEIITAMQKIQDKNQFSSYYQYLKDFKYKADDGPSSTPAGGGGGGGWWPVAPNNYTTIFYSGYNASLITLQAVLGLPIDDIVTPVHPGSAIIFELHQDSITSGHYGYSVQVLWIDGSIEPLTPEVINIPSCGTQCDFTTFVEMTEKFANITSYTSECQTST